MHRASHEVARGGGGGGSGGGGDGGGGLGGGDGGGFSGGGGFVGGLPQLSRHGGAISTEPPLVFLVE